MLAVRLPKSANNNNLTIQGCFQISWDSNSDSSLVTGELLSEQHCICTKKLVSAQRLGQRQLYVFHQKASVKQVIAFSKQTLTFTDLLLVLSTC